PGRFLALALRAGSRAHRRERPDCWPGRVPDCLGIAGAEVRAALDRARGRFLLRKCSLERDYSSVRFASFLGWPPLWNGRRSDHGGYTGPCTKMVTFSAPAGGRNSPSELSCARRCRRTEARKTAPRPSLMKLFKLLSQG